MDFTDCEFGSTCEKCGKLPTEGILYPLTKTTSDKYFYCISCHPVGPTGPGLSCLENENGDVILKCEMCGRESGSDCAKIEHESRCELQTQPLLYYAKIFEGSWKKCEEDAKN